MDGPFTDNYQTDVEAYGGRWASDHDGHHMLLAAIVHRAVLDYLHDVLPADRQHAKERGDHYRSAREFLFYETTPYARPWSFRWIASILSDDADGLIEKVRAYASTAPRLSEQVRACGGSLQRARARGKAMF